jgi:hypothetical protein
LERITDLGIVESHHALMVVFGEAVALRYANRGAPFRFDECLG